ncbi:MAG: glycosyltransferase family 39 protein [Lachnospiraceae bacterium]|nr:glycosyltransferase family 39 protein [Lachnospiraceae bacterium]
MKKKPTFTIKKIISFLSAWKYLLMTLLVSGIYPGILYNQTLPFAEGWYTYYAQCINAGEVVYRDFDYLFTPLYIRFIALVTRIFGYDLIVLRFIGVIFFVLIALVIFLIFRELFDDRISAVVTVASVMYMQSEVVQIFYDYIRMMDIFSLLSVLLLIRFIRNHNNERKALRLLTAAGVSNALFLLIKQNMGLVFFAFALILITAVCLVTHEKLRILWSRLLAFAAGFAVPMLICGLIMLIEGSLGAFFAQTGAAALAAKGGALAVIFNWIPNNMNVFVMVSGLSAVMLILVAASFAAKRYLPGRTAEGSGMARTVITVAFLVVSAAAFMVFAKHPGPAKTFDRLDYLNPYALFLVMLPLFIVMVVRTVHRSSKGTTLTIRELQYIAIAGAYIAIAWGCGMSGGIAEGQSTLAVGFIAGVVLYNLQFRYADLFTGAAVLGALVLTLQCGAKKMANTYNWWDMDEADLWASVEESPDIPLLRGIGLSEDTLEACETIYHVITEHTDSDDPIYCFPHIPVFYSICDRTDPGVRAKVQWFDVVSDSSIDRDMLTLEENLPKAILIYETSENAYDSHERLFRGGGVSATRRMKQFLLDLTSEYGYTFYGRIEASENNTFRLFYLDGDAAGKLGSFEGEGTKESPYLISSADDLVFLQRSVDNGNDYKDVFFRQTADIDLSAVQNWIPIGRFGSGRYFCGIYDGAGHEIRNMNCIHPDENVGFFGQLGGVVCNLGIVGGQVRGAYSGVIASHAVDADCAIVNCYTASDITGLRAGGIADNFCGSVINCVSRSSCSAKGMAGALTFEAGACENVYDVYELIDSGVISGGGDPRSVTVRESYMKLDDIILTLNNHASSKADLIGNDEEPADRTAAPDWVYQVDFAEWEHGSDGFPVLKVR